MPRIADDDDLSRLPASIAFDIYTRTAKPAGDLQMKIVLPIALTLLAVASPALSQSDDFTLTYHVERTPAAKLGLATCGDVVANIARQSRLSVDVQSFPGQLVIVKGGRAGAGAFVVQCIAVGNTTVSVVQGIDYKASKGALGQIADRAFAALTASIK